jgi:hypothetical protein
LRVKLRARFARVPPTSGGLNAGATP